VARIQVEREGEKRAKEEDVLTTTYSSKKVTAEWRGRKAF